MNIGDVAQLITHYQFWALLPIACVSGAPFGFVVGTLIALHYMNLFEAAAILVLGDLIPDTIYYSIGRYGRRSSLLARYGPRVGITSDRVDSLSRVWHLHTGKMMWIGKLASGLSHWFLISAGMSRIPMRTFYFYSLPVTITQYTVTLALGFFLGETLYPLVARSISGLGILITCATSIFIIYYVFARYMRGMALRIEKRGESR